MNFQQNETVPIEVRALDGSRNGVTGATITLTIKRHSDGHFWNGSAFQSGVATVAMSEVDATNFAGLYRYSFNTNGLADDYYTVKVTSSTTTVINDPWAGSFRVGGFVDNIVAASAIASAVGAVVIESQGSYTLQQALSILLAALAGVTDAPNATTRLFKTPDGAATRITGTVNTDEERTAVTLAPSA